MFSAWHFQEDILELLSRNPFVNQVVLFRTRRTVTSDALRSQSLRESGRFVHKIKKEEEMYRVMSQSLRESGRFVPVER